MVYPRESMKQSTRKSNGLSLVTATYESRELPQLGPERGEELTESFDGWLSSVAPTLVQSTPKEKRETSVPGRRSLSSVDVVRVNRATIRESSIPRHWPPDVVLSFLAADVIKRNKQEN